jgi:hypothetical protein
MEDFETKMRRGGAAALEEASKFFMRKDPVHLALEAIAQRLDQLAIPYAVAGGMALVAHGYDRTTVDVDIVVTSEALDVIHKSLDGLGYVRAFPKSRNLKDTQRGVRIEFLVTGQFPGDGKPKPVAFPDPGESFIEIDGIRYVGLPSLVELKLASGMTNPARLKDLADVQELIRTLTLAQDFAGQLNPYVQEKYAELWTAVQNDPGLEG